MGAGGIRSRYCGLCRNEGYDGFPPADFVVNAPEIYNTKSQGEAPRGYDDNLPFWYDVELLSRGPRPFDARQMLLR